MQQLTCQADNRVLPSPASIVDPVESPAFGPKAREFGYMLSVAAWTWLNQFVWNGLRECHLLSQAS